MKRILSLLMIFSLLLFVWGCSPKVMVQKPPKDAQVKQFITDRQITPLAIGNIGDSFTVILYETESEMGHYAVSVNSDGTLATHQATSNNNSNITKVSIGGVATGIPFATVIINDRTLLQKADRVGIRFANGDEVSESVNGQKGLIIPHEKVSNSNVSIQKVEIYDKDKRLLFSQE